MKKTLLTGFLAFLFCTNTSSAQTIVYVNSSASGANDGTTWNDAYVDLQTALTNISTGEIWVAGGIYFPSATSGTGYSFHMKNGVKVYGGFNGTETVLGQRNWLSNTTTLSGDLDRSGDFSGGDSYHVVYMDNVDNTCVLDGFIITGGNTNGSGSIFDSMGSAVSVQPNGGGTYSPQISNCIMTNNYGTTIGVLNWNSIGTTAAPNFYNCIIHDNSGEGSYTLCEGAGAYSSPHYENCLFYNNSGGEAAAAEHANGGRTDASYTNCTLFNNGSSAIYYRTYGGPGSFTMNNCITYGENTYADSPITANNCDIDPSAGGYFSGSGIIESDPLFINVGAQNFALSCLSPCIDQGGSFTTQSVDLKNNPRISGVAVDMGAYETNYAPPVVTAAASSSIVCMGLPVTLTGSGANTYIWDNGVVDGVSFNPTSTIQYNVTGTDANGCTGTAQITVTVNSLPIVSASATYTTICYGYSTTLTGSGALSYMWDNSVSDGIAFTPTITTLYNVTGTDINGCNNTAQITVYVNNLPVVLISPTSNTVCQGQPDTLNSNVSGGMTPYSYSWTDLQTTATYTDSIISIIPVTTPGSSYQLMVTDFNGCVAAATLSVAVSPADSLSGIITEPNSSLVTAGKVYLFKQNINHINNADSVSVGTIGLNGVYHFPAVYYGNYFVKVVADTTTYPFSIGTYYSNKPNAYQWDSALIIHQFTCSSGNNSGKDITVIEIIPQTGPGTITGNVTEGPGFGMRYGSGGYSPMGAPLKGVDIKLGKNPGGSPAARTTTDNSGNYTFNNIPVGDYKIYVDIPNYGMDSVRLVSLTPADTASIHNDYFVDSTNVRVVPQYTTSITTSVCQGDSIFAGGAYQQLAGVYYDNLHTIANGYDSLIVTTLILNPLPPLSVSANDTAICVGDNVVLTASGASAYTWNTTETSYSITVNPTSTSVYSVTGTGNGCVTSTSFTVTVNMLPIVTASVSTDPVCAGGAVTFNGGGALTYTWTNGVIDATPFTPIGTNTFTVSGTDLNACINSATVSVTVNPLPVVTATTSANSVCTGNTVTLNGGGALTYSWTNGVIDATPFTPATGTDTYTVIGTDVNACVNSATVSITVNPLPVVTATTSADTVCAGNAVTLNGGGALTYSWTNGVIDATPFTPATGTDTYTVSGTDANSCVNTATVSVVVNSCVGINTFSNNAWSTYPNPAINQLFIESTGNAKIKLYNTTGQLILEKEIVPGKNSIIVSEFPNGIYTLQYIMDGKISFAKVMINR